MTDFKLRQEDIDHGHVRDNFNILQQAVDLSEHGRRRVDEAMRATVAHVEERQGLTQGMRSKDIGIALSFLDNRYEGRHDLKPLEREVIEKSFNSHFHIKDAPVGHTMNKKRRHKPK